MFEVEKKVALDRSQLYAIECDATFLGAQLLTDTYFDTPNFQYTTNDIWLSESQSGFKLRLGSRSSREGYKEITEEEEIIENLGIEGDKDLPKALQKAQISPFSTFQRAIRKYQLQGFTIELDLAYTDDFIYRVGRFQLIVASEEEIPQAEKEIRAFTQELGIDQKEPIKEKLMEYLSQKSPNHYQALIDSGIIAR